MDNKIKYLVAQLKGQALTLDGDDQSDLEEEDREFSVYAIVMCNNTRDVAKAINEVRDRSDRSWQVFELVENKTKECAVMFKFDGRAMYDVEIW